MSEGERERYGVRETVGERGRESWRGERERKERKIERERGGERGRE